MRHSANLAILFALGTAIAFVGCSSSDDTAETPGTPGTGGKDGGTAGHVATGGSDAGSGGSSTGGKDGGTGGTVANTGGTDAGSGGSSTGGTDAGSGGSSTGGTDAGAGGTDAGSGGSSTGGTDAGGTDAGADAGGTDAGSTDAGGTCDETVPTAIGALAALVLVDDVQVKNAGSTLVTEWPFADNTSIIDQSVYPPATGKWTRSPYPVLSQSADAHDAFLACDGSAAIGSLEATVPFAAKNEYFELMTTVTKADFSGYTVSAKVKLADGATCVAAYLYTINSVDPYHQAQGTNTALTKGSWVTISVTVPSDGLSTAVDSFVLNLNTYNCP